jgi:hypothetical protein
MTIGCVQCGRFQKTYPMNRYYYCLYCGCQFRHNYEQTPDYYLTHRRDCCVYFYEYIFSKISRGTWFAWEDDEENALKLSDSYLSPRQAWELAGMIGGFV